MKYSQVEGRRQTFEECVLILLRQGQKLSIAQLRRKIGVTRFDYYRGVNESRILQAALYRLKRSGLVDFDRKNRFWGLRKHFSLASSSNQMYISA